MKKLTVTVMILVVCCVRVYADVNSAMDSYLNNISVTGNASTIVQTQSANVFSAGGFATRSQSVTLQPFSFSPPSFSSSCGNIDFYGGSFSYLSNTDQLMKFLQNTIITAAPLIFMQALKVISPDLQGAIQEFWDQAQKLLNLASNSCQLGTYLGTMGGNAIGGAIKQSMGSNMANGDGSVTPALTGSSVNGDSGFSLASGAKKAAQAFDSWATNLNGILNPSIDSNNAAIQDEIAVYGSIVWQGLQKQIAIQSVAIDQRAASVSDVSNLILSVTGDVYIGKDTADDNMVRTRAYPVKPAININDLYDSLPAGKFVYDCNGFLEHGGPNDECYLNGTSGFQDPVKTGKYAALTTTIRGKVESMLTNVSNNLLNGTTLTNNDLAIIAMVKVPIFQLAQALYDSGMGSQMQNFLKQYSPTLAYQITYGLMSDVLSNAMMAIAAKNVGDNEQVKLAVQNLIARIGQQQQKLVADQAKYDNLNPIEMLQQINSLRAFAQAQYAPGLIQKVQFAKSFNNH